MRLLKISEFEITSVDCIGYTYTLSMAIFGTVEQKWVLSNEELQKSSVKVFTKLSSTVMAFTSAGSLIN